MSALLFLPLAATSVGGAIALGALFHYFNGSNVDAKRLTRGTETTVGGAQALSEEEVSAFETAVREERERSEQAFAELERQRRELGDFFVRASAELDARRVALETLTAQATEAATTLGRVLDSFSIAFGASAERGTPRENPRRKQPILKKLASASDASTPAADAFEPFFALEDELRLELGAASGRTTR